MPNSKNYDLDIDTTLGGSNASDYIIPSQKAIKTYVDNNSGGGSSTDVQINGTSITSQGVANIITNSAYNASSNKIATMSDLPTVVTYTGGTGISIGTGNAINHTNSVTAGTAGTSSATSGSSLAVPYVTYDAQGHVTASGTHTHTVTGFLTSITSGDVTSALGYTPYNSTNPSGYITGSSSYVASSRFDGQWISGNASTLTSASASGNTDVTSTLKNLMGAAGTDSYKYELIIEWSMEYSATANLGYNTSIVTGVLIDRSTSNAGMKRGTTIVPVGADKALTITRSAKMASCNIYLVAYRRIGTNT